jgi:hypothetical protein
MISDTSTVAGSGSSTCVDQSRMRVIRSATPLTSNTRCATCPIPLTSIA